MEVGIAISMDWLSHEKCWGGDVTMGINCRKDSMFAQGNSWFSLPATPIHCRCLYEVLRSQCFTKESSERHLVKGKIAIYGRGMTTVPLWAAP